MDIDRARLSPALSVYFNLVRFCAAATVMLAHYCSGMFGEAGTKIPGHDAVVVFFVLSGYVIAYVSDGKDASLRDYALNRLSRLWSVAVPAAGVAAVAALVVGSVSVTPWASSVSSVSEFASRLLLNLSFMAYSWFGEVGSPYNDPFWSLNYEAWYYAIFGAWTFLEGRARIGAVVICCVIAGPLALALMPCWLVGVALYRYRRSLTVAPVLAYCLFAASILGYAAASYVNLVTASRLWLKWLTAGQSYHLGGATSAIGDAMLALLVAANFIAAANMPLVGRLLLPLKRWIDEAASYTLSIYLYHAPLFALIVGGAGLGHRQTDAPLVFLIAATGIVVLGRLTEHRRSAWKAGLARLRLQRVGSVATLK